MPSLKLGPEQTPNIVETMNQYRWFAELPDDLRADIFQCSQPRWIEHGEYLFHREQQATAWYGVFQGSVKITAHAQDGREYVLTFMKPGAWFGENALLDGRPRTHDGLAHGKTGILVMPQAAFYELLSKYPSFSLAVMRQQCHRFRLLLNIINSKNSLPVEARIAQQLLDLASAYGKNIPEGIAIDLHLPQDELAHLLGVSRQSINQSVKQWERLQVLRQHYGRFVLLNPEYLIGVANPAG